MSDSGGSRPRPHCRRSGRWLHRPDRRQWGRGREPPESDIPPFCAPPCYITSIVPDLIYWKDPNPALTDGMTANYNGADPQGVWLHHDAVANGCLQTVFLSGNERTVYQSPAGYGSLIGVPGSPDDPNSCNFQWFVGWHIHNSGNAPHNV